MWSNAKVTAIHVGAHKTGTSVFQQYLRENPKLLRRKRVLVVRRAELRDYAGWGDRLIADPGPLAARVEEFRRHPWFTTMIGSYENMLGRPFARRGRSGLYPQAAPNLAALATALANSRAKVLLTIRPQADFVESYYLQSVHEGGVKTFEQWVRRIDLDALSWTPIVDACRASFGADAVEIVDFQLIRQGQEAYLEHLLRCMDPRLNWAVTHPSTRNRSVSERGLRMALAANPHVSGEDRSALRRFLQEHFSNADFPRPLLFTGSQRQALRDRYDAEYTALVGHGPLAAPAGATS